MGDYRIYRLDGAGQITGAPEIVTAAGDEAAVSAVRALNSACSIEIWQGRRLIARVPAGNDWRHDG